MRLRKRPEAEATQKRTTTSRQRSKLAEQVRKVKRVVKERQK